MGIRGRGSVLWLVKTFKMEMAMVSESKKPNPRFTDCCGRIFGPGFLSDVEQRISWFRLREETAKEPWAELPDHAGTGDWFAGFGLGAN